MFIVWFFGYTFPLIASLHWEGKGGKGDMKQRKERSRRNKVPKMLPELIGHLAIQRGKIKLRKYVPLIPLWRFLRVDPGGGRGRVATWKMDKKIRIWNCGGKKRQTSRERIV
jgi:hypothetical protein